MLGLVDGRRGVFELIALTGRGEFTCVSALAAMVDRGLLSVRAGDDGDSATVLIRRHQVLSRLEGSTPVSSPSLAAAVSGAVEAEAPRPVMEQQSPQPQATASAVTAPHPEDRNVTPAR